MGVPKFALWLSKKYPTIVNSACPDPVHGLYVDLNGLIHPCCHSESDVLVARRSEEEKLRCICRELEVLVATVRPRQVLYIASDGVAPRAKMNQQRARRYMGRATRMSSGAEIVEEIVREFTPNELTEVDGDLDDVRQLLMSDALYGSAVTAGDILEDLTAVDEKTTLARPTGLFFDNSDVANPDAAPSTVGNIHHEDSAGVTEFDSNCISPGTVFMGKVADAILAMVQEKLATGDPLWAKLRVVVSGADTPGEGEHKIISFCRTQSCYEGFNGRGAHVIVGLDADLIFLSLSLHISHIFILRDNCRNPYKKRSKHLKKQVEDEIKSPTKAGAADADVLDNEDDGENCAMDGNHGNNNHNRTSSTSSSGDSGEFIKQDFVPVEACVTYEYYDIDAVGSSLMSELHGLCQIRGFSVASKEAFRPEVLVSSGGYHFCRQAGEACGAPRSLPCSEEEKWQDFQPCNSHANCKVIDDVIVMAMLMGNDFLPHLPSAFCGESALDNLMELYVGDILPHGFLTKGNHEINLLQLQRLFEAYAKVETVKFRRFARDRKMALKKSKTLSCVSFDADWRKLYLKSTGLYDHLDEACKKYVEGLRFVWRYYTSNSTQCSWSWYYPFHHAPFASDIANYLRRCHLRNILPPPPPLEKTPPDTFVQLLSILPPTSHALLPPALGDVMLNPPEELRETFPTTWRVDCTAAYGKDHLAAVLLPFANVTALSALVEETQLRFTEEERRRRQQMDYSIVLSTPAAEFELHGDISEFSAGDAALLGLRREGVTFMRLRDTPPNRGRPKTYSCAVAVPWVTCDGQARVRPAERLSRRERRDVRDGAFPAKGVRVIRKGPSFASYLFGLAIFSLLTAILMPPPTLPLLLQVIALNIAAIALSFVIGISGNDSVAGSVIRRNNIRMACVNWLCDTCMTLNFSTNDKCFACRAPFDAHRCSAVFGGTRPVTPPLYDPDHTQYMETFSLGAQKPHFNS